MNCNEFVELVTAYLEGALDADAEQRFITHMAECDGCDRYLDQMRTTVTTLGHLPAEGLGPDVRDELVSAFRNWTVSDRPGFVRGEDRNPDETRENRT